MKRRRTIRKPRFACILATVALIPTLSTQFMDNMVALAPPPQPAVMHQQYSAATVELELNIKDYLKIEARRTALKSSDAAHSPPCGGGCRHGRRDSSGRGSRGRRSLGRTRWQVARRARGTSRRIANSKAKRSELQERSAPV